MKITNEKRQKLKTLLEMSNYGDVVKIVDGKEVDFNIETEGVDMNATYKLKGSAIDEVSPGQVWKMRGGGIALVLQRDDLGGFPQKEFSCWTSHRDSTGFSRVDEYGRTGELDSALDLVQKVSNDSRTFFRGSRMDMRTPNGLE